MQASHRGRQVPRPLTALLGTAIALLALAGPAHAGQNDVRIDIDVVDLAGAPVGGVTVIVTGAGVDAVAVTDAYGGARVKIDLPGLTTLSVAASAPTLGGTTELLQVEPGARYDVEFTATVAQGFDLVSEATDLTGDGLPDVLWHRAHPLWQDDWIVLGGDGAVIEERFAPGPVVAIEVLDLDGEPGREVLALVETSGAPSYRAYVYSPASGALERSDLGVLTGLDFIESDFDGSGDTDLLFVPPGAQAAGFGFTILFGNGDVERFSLGGPSSYFYPELADVTGDGLDDVFVSEVIPGQTVRWMVWESDTQEVGTADHGTHGETVFDATLLDGDSDGLPEFLAAFEVDGDSRGWEVLEYASGNQFEVVLPLANDRGPGSGDYPASWFE